MIAKLPTPGVIAPDFTLPDETGRPVKLSDFRGRRVILYFYPKDETKGCTAQACGFRDVYPQVEARDGVVIGISPDGKASHQKFKAKHDLPFILLTDENHAVAEAFGVWGEKAMYGRKYMGIIRSHFVIDENGRVIDAQVKVRPADSVARALETLEQI